MFTFRGGELNAFYLWGIELRDVLAYITPNGTEGTILEIFSDFSKNIFWICIISQTIVVYWVKYIFLETVTKSQK